MKLIIFSDIHQDWEALQKVLSRQADYYVCLGDFTNSGNGYQKGMELLSQKGEKLLLIHGNSETPQQIKMASSKWGVTDLHQNAVEHEGFTLAGMGGCNLTPFNTPGDVPENQLRDWLDELRGIENLVLFTHVPPHNTKIDCIDNNVHVGSKALREFIDEEEPLFCFSGHVHDNVGMKEQLGRTKCRIVGKTGFELTLPEDGDK